MEWQETIKRWSQTQVKVIDIRHLAMKAGDELASYRLPACAFIIANQGGAKLRLDGMEVASAPMQVLHGGKGAHLNIRALKQPFDYYLILYKPLDGLASPSAHKRNEPPAPFGRIYTFQARYPLALLALLEPMYKQWTSTEALDRLQVMGLFYQFVHEQFRQLQMEESDTSAPELAAQIAHFIQEHYEKAISMEMLASCFHYSTHYLSRVFKRKYGCSPIEYLIQTRINRAKFLLNETDVTIREVADSIGYTDMYYFSRLFKKQTGATPAQFKMHNLALKGSVRTNFMPESFIAAQAGEGYIVNSDNHYQQNAWRVNEMNFRFKPSFAVTLLFSLSLLLAACGGAEPEVKQNAGGNNTQQAESTDALPAETRLYKDALGREVKIPVQPSKAVVVTYGGYLLPLGLEPVGADKGTIDLYPDAFADVESIGEGLGNVEAISALQPDIIILPDYHSAEIYETYQKIAPTVAVAWGGDPDVINTLRDMGDVMNRKPEAEAWISKFEEKLQRIREQINVNIKPGTTAATFILYNGEVLLGGKGGTLGKLIYEDFGFKMPQQFEQYADGGTALSMEALIDRPADYFFTQMTVEELPEMTKLFQEPVYQAIPAVKNNRIINVTRNKWNYGPYLVDEAVDAFIEAVGVTLK
ncbi:ABC transporter substrate-binding protein [Paenibacillus paridis]|uniref:ABC transporter substrate-binding protein n=1 Tax=Paenibacillus paridis TaxID=2583376 RepID=UPI0011219316|nr:ABC transporter substrate-binding protein [Paenibacillus paridis]